MSICRPSLFRSLALLAAWAMASTATASPVEWVKPAISFPGPPDREFSAYAEGVVKSPTAGLHARLTFQCGNAAMLSRRLDMSLTVYRPESRTPIQESIRFSYPATVYPVFEDGRAWNAARTVTWAKWDGDDGTEGVIAVQRKPSNFTMKALPTVADDLVIHIPSPYYLAQPIDLLRSWQTVKALTINGSHFEETYTFPMAAIVEALATHPCYQRVMGSADKAANNGIDK